MLSSRPNSLHPLTSPYMYRYMQRDHVEPQDALLAPELVRLIRVDRAAVDAHRREGVHPLLLAQAAPLVGRAVDAREDDRLRVGLL